MRVVAVADLARALGPGLVRLLVDAPERRVEDATIDEPVGAPGAAGRHRRDDLVFGPAVVDAAGAVDLVRQAARYGATGVVLRRGPARARGVRAAARRHGVALLELTDDASLVHVVGLVRDVLDRSTARGSDRGDGAGRDLGGDLMALAEAAARVVDAPVTIEDAHSRVLAYSSQHDVTDPARVSTIVGRRVPAEVVARMRSLGVFRRMLRSDEPFLVLTEFELPRYVVPVRAGGEWLGSIWAVVDEEPPPEVVTELRRTAGVVALHLLRSRAAADLARSVVTERIRAAIRGEPTDPPASSWLPPGPWRVVVLDAGGSGRAGPADLDAWDSRLRREGWRQPLLAEVAGRVHAVVSDAVDPGPRAVAGSWGWLAAHAGSAAAAGLRVTDPADLPGSALVAHEVAALRADEAATPESQWSRLTLARAVAALAAPGQADAALDGPVATLAAHDERRHTAYLPTLAAWLDHPGEPTVAARTLGVHVNTLRHRMVRMGAVTSMRLDDPTERLALRLRLAARGL